MTVNSPLVLRIRLNSSDRSKAMIAHVGSNTKTISNASFPSLKTACVNSSGNRKKPSGMSKEMRRARNRITARESRDRRAAYILQLENDVKQLNERVAQLESDLARSNPTTSFMIDYSNPVLLSPEQMGFFDV